MSSFEIIPQQNYKRLMWKNGLGHTDEIAIYPPGSELKRGDFLWRLSSARIEQESPFSVFPAHDRVLVVLKGEGVRLTHTFEEGGEEETTDLGPLSPYEFPGDVPSRCEIPAGPITDLSVFVRKAEVEAMVEVLELGEGEDYAWYPAGRWNFAFATEGSFQIHSPSSRKPLRLCEGDTVRVELEEPALEEDVVRFIPTQKSGKLVIIALQGTD